MDFFSVGGTLSDAKAVYEHDIHHCVAFCHAMIGECSLPSTGLGWEFGTAIEKRGIPTLLLAEDGKQVTRLVIGAGWSDKSRAQFHQYHNQDDMLRLSLGFIKKQQGFLFSIRCLLIDFCFALHRAKKKLIQSIQNLKGDWEFSEQMR